MRDREAVPAMPLAAKEGPLPVSSGPKPASSSLPPPMPANPEKDGAVATGGIGTAPDKTLASVIAPDGDRDPFGIAIVPLTMGKLTAGNLLVAEFGDKKGTAGAGTTILQVNPATGKTSVFFRGGPVAGPVGVAINPANNGVLERTHPRRACHDRHRQVRRRKWSTLHHRS